MTKFLVLGRIGIDIYPENRAKIADAELMRPVLGGSSGNIAAGLARLGADVEMLSVVANDPTGQFVRRECAAYGIGTRYLGTAAKGFNTTLAFAENRLEDFEVVLYRNHAADLALDLAAIDAVDFDEFDALIVTGTALSAEPSRGATIEAMRRAKCAVLDLDYRAAAWIDEEPSEIYREALEVAQIAIGNDLEFALLGGVEAAREFGRARLAVYKMGAEGALTIDHGKEWETPIFPVEALKPVGSGDAFMAGFMIAYLEGRGTEIAVKEGAANAAIVVAREGCAPAMPTRAELDEFLDARSM